MTRIDRAVNRYSVAFVRACPAKSFDFWQSLQVKIACAAFLDHIWLCADSEYATVFGFALVDRFVHRLCVLSGCPVVGMISCRKGVSSGLVLIGERRVHFFACGVGRLFRLPRPSQHYFYCALAFFFVDPRESSSKAPVQSARGARKLGALIGRYKLPFLRFRRFYLTDSAVCCEATLNEAPLMLIVSVVFVHGEQLELSILRMKRVGGVSAGHWRVLLVVICRSEARICLGCSTGRHGSMLFFLSFGIFVFAKSLNSFRRPNCDFGETV